MDSAAHHSWEYFTSRQQEKIRKLGITGVGQHSSPARPRQPPEGPRLQQVWVHEEGEIFVVSIEFSVVKEVVQDGHCAFFDKCCEHHHQIEVNSQ